ncbi:uncharacterized protein LOC114126391 isoform X1 [Aphis gossypii]|uniref:GH18 domain-containing protein n=2 Tax=Aphis gossypii TaxID=80765 RepID=A0A9P0JHT8_APHGO|nr:uncharacterized protein LOC114126391 isoform X1 [Aphis gossypii]CAH1737161.1 unnamed protein product [Aphis gossypii]
MTSFMVTIFIVILHILYISPNINAQNRQDIEIGTSGCRYAGYIDPERKKCNGQDVMPVDDLPFACSSYFYGGITCLDDFTIESSKNPNDDDNLLSLTSLTKRVFLLYGRKNYITSWTNVNFYEGIRTESRNLQAFIKDNPVAGIVLTGIDGPINLPDNDYYTRFQSYVTQLRISIKYLKVGLYLNATAIISNKDNKQWFDFSKMNLLLDYYLITFRDFNDCTKELLNGGTTPMDSKDPKINTLNKFADALNALNIDKEKVYFEFVMTPTIPFAKLPTTLPCEITYSEYCLNKPNFMCVDNQNTFYEKGLFAKKHSKGWVGYGIDLIDRQQACKCEGDKFTTFFMLMKGYNEKEMLTCDKLKC